MNIKGFLLAFQFLTRFSIRRDIAATPEELGRSGVWFPVVGLALGLFLVILNLLLGLWLPDIIVNILLILSLIVFCGALHLDGLIDLADGLYAGSTPQEVLKVMRDTQVGSMGVIALFGLLLLKVFSLNAIDPVYKNSILVIMPVLSRWCILYAAAKYDYARKETGVGRVFTRENDMQQFMMASIFPVGITLFLLGLKGLWLLLLVLIAVSGLGRVLNKKLGGMTGDSLGAINEIMETSILLFLLILVNN